MQEKTSVTVEVLHIKHCLREDGHGAKLYFKKVVENYF
jgi:hypothetical protein